jgi:hypothetical protein
LSQEERRERVEIEGCPPIRLQAERQMETCAGAYIHAHVGAHVSTHTKSWDVVLWRVVALRRM